MGDSSLILLLVIRRHIPVERTYVSGGVIAFVNERFGDACAHASQYSCDASIIENAREPVHVALGCCTGRSSKYSSLLTSRLSHALHTSHTRSCTNTTIFSRISHMLSTFDPP